MSIYEQYTANIPLYFPAQEAILKRDDCLSEVTWHKLAGKPEVAGVACTEDMVANWKDHIGLADYYQWPHIQYFHGKEDLFEQVRSDQSWISQKMKEENVGRKNETYANWRKILERIR